MKKTLTILLICIMIAASTACSSKSNEEQVEKPIRSPSSTSSHTTVSTTNQEQINLNKYVSVTFGGYDLAGYASVAFNKEMFLLDHIDHIAFNEDNFQVYQDLHGNITKSAANTIINYITVGLDKSHKLSNGDTVRLVWNINTEKTETYFQWDYTCHAEPFTVTGLPTAPTFDPFEKLEVTFAGEAPFGTVSMYNYGQSYRGTYTISPNSNLKNGDKIVVTYSCDDKATMIENYGKYPATVQKTYTVSGLNSYVLSTTELSSEQKNQLVSEAKEKIWLWNPEKYEDAKYCGEYLFVAKDSPVNELRFGYTGLTPVGNAICFVFEHPKEIGATNYRTSYIIIALENLFIKENGELVYDKHLMTQLHQQYSTLDELTTDFVDIYKNLFYCFDNVNFE